MEIKEKENLAERSLLTTPEFHSLSPVIGKFSWKNNYLQALALV